MFKILITGPESTGKSSLVEALSQYFNTSYVAEYAREYIDGLHRDYQEEDLLEIAKGQLNKEDEAFLWSHELLFIDTDLSVIDIWSQEVFGKTNPWIIEQLNRRNYDLYLIPDVDLAWTYDPQRENPKDRGRLLKLYQQSFENRNITYHMVRGEGEERVQNAVGIVERFLKNKKML